MAASSAGSEGWTSGLSAPDGSAAGKSSATPSACRCWKGTGQMSLAFATSERSAASSNGSTSSPGASLARMSPSPGQEPGSPASAADSGPSSLESCPACDPVGFSLRTSLASELRAQTGCCMTWRREDPPRGRAWWGLDMSELRTVATGSGSWDWPTPQATDAVEEWPTPAASTWSTNQGGGMGRVGPVRPSLEHLIENGGFGRADQESPSTTGRSREWSTPNAKCAEDSQTHRSGARSEELLLTGQVRGSAQATGGRLNHRWVAQLMGFPVDWLDIDEPRSEPSATPASRR